MASPAASANNAAQEPLTKARFLHAVPGAPSAQLVVHGHPPRLVSSYGKPSAYHACRPGPAKIDLIVKGERKPVARTELEIGRGVYTVVAVPDGDKVAIRAYKDDGVAPGKASLRTIHAAGELMGADVNVDGERISRIEQGEATGYTRVPPGRHSVSITRPGGEGGRLASASATLSAGTSSTAFVVGSAGEPTDVVLVSDQTAGPVIAPATGVIDGTDPNWLLVLSAAMMAGSLGGAAYLFRASGGR